MRIAVFSDVHGNAVALDAVLADISVQQPDTVIFAGDLALGGPEPEACVARVRGLRIPCIRGNTDEWLTERPDPPDDAMVRWARACLSPASRSWLTGLPFEHRFDDLAVVHATPWSISDAVFPDAGERALRRMLTEARAATVVYGHIHRAWVGRVPGAGVIVNAGSVGFPFDGDARASYALLVREGAGWAPEIRRIAYDIERSAAAFPRDHPAPDRWAAMMRRGRRDV
jgi:putative phosphoesterase